MNDSASLDSFLAKWRTQWPEWSVAEVFLPMPQRQRARAWLALRGELTEAAWGGDDPTPGAAKLGWWEEELAGWSRGARRHPLGLTLQKLPLDWPLLAAAIPALRASRSPEADRAASLRGLEPFARAQATLSAQLFDATAPASTQATAEALLAEWVLHLPIRGVPAAGTDIPSLLALPSLRDAPRTERIHAALVRARLGRLARGAKGPLPAPVALLAAWRAARG
ncbi:phytoene/squalene synthase family protein [Thermomonas sp.]|jgi:phytoene/squalene synthetase|uniref:phytoene/squalene synthase family protein n=1 Tax=Thermomonas sp. TaxID=1971895 RepID=UPI00257DE102|nr:phytoene/squalene synthase family protein [Thermomonas sp.]